MMVELMREGGVDLSRRWIAALLLAPEEDREAIVDSIEARLSELYPPDLADCEDRLMHVAGEPLQRDGFIEQVIRSYSPATDQEASGTSRERSAG